VPCEKRLRDLTIRGVVCGFHRRLKEGETAPDPGAATAAAPRRPSRDRHAMISRLRKLGKKPPKAKTGEPGGGEPQSPPQPPPSDDDIYDSGDICAPERDRDDETRDL